MPRNPPPLSSFGPELQTALRKGIDREYRITFASHDMATRFKQRVNQLRQAMKHENHADWKNLYRVGLYNDRRDSRVVIIAPKDYEFNSFLDAAGVPDLPPTPPKESATAIPGPSGSVDDFLAELHQQDTDEPSEPNLGDL